MDNQAAGIAPDVRQRRSFGQVEELPSGRANAVFYADGQRYRRACTDKREARKRLDAVEFAIEHGRPVAEVLSSVFGDPGGARSRFAEVVGEYVKHAEATGVLKESTLSAATRLYRFLCESAPWAGKRIGKVTRVDVGDWLGSRIKNDGISVATANRFLSAVSTVFRFAVSRGWATENPCRMIQRYSEAGREKGICLTPDQSQRLIDAAPDDHFRLFLLAAIETGARKGELLALRWRNVNLQDGIITFEAETTKTRSRRPVPMTPCLKKALTAALPRDPALDGPVFMREPRGEKERPMTGGAVRTRFKRTLENCREGKNELPAEILGELRLHDARHTGASYWLHSTKDLFLTCRIIGHSSSDMVMQRYGHVLAAGLKNAARVRGRAIRLTADVSTAATVSAIPGTPDNTPKEIASS